MYLTSLIELLLISSSVLLLLPASLLMLECIAGAIPMRRQKKEFANQSSRPSLDVLIPAHNEQSVLARTLNSIRPQLRSADRLCVVADNCTDDTASIAREAGALVVERFDDAHRAKGYAIAKGLQVLSDDPRDVVVMIDADCLIGDRCLESLGRMAIDRKAPIQAKYSMESRSSGWNAVSSFAVAVKNHVRPLGLSRLGYGCSLTGSGMAFPSDVARQVQWASGNIVEDMKLSYDYAISGATPQYCQDATVTASLPVNAEDAMNQRKRWEHGHLQTIVSQVPRLVFHGVRSLRFDLFVSAIDLLIPPLSLFVQLWLMGTGCTLALTLLLNLSPAPLVISMFAGVALFAGVLAAWISHGRAVLPFTKLCVIPFYVLSKIPLYLTALVRRQMAWNRTARSETEATACT